MAPGAPFGHPGSMSTPHHACRFCQGEVLPEAAKCRHCGEWLRALCPHCGGLCDADSGTCPTCIQPLATPRPPRKAILVMKALAVLQMGQAFSALGVLVRSGWVEEPVLMQLVAGALGTALASLGAWLYWIAARNLNVILIGLLTVLTFIGTLGGLIAAASPAHLLLAVLLQALPFLGTAYALHQALVWHREQQEAPIPLPAGPEDLPAFLLKPRFWFPPAEHLPGLLAWVVTLMGISGVLSVARSPRIWELLAAFAVLAPGAYLLVYRLRLLGARSPRLGESLRAAPGLHAAMGLLTLGAAFLLPREAPPVPAPEPVLEAVAHPQAPAPDPADPWADGAPPLSPLAGVQTPEQPFLPVHLGGQGFLLPLGEGAPRPVLKAGPQGFEPQGTLPPLPLESRILDADEARALVEGPRGLQIVTLGPTGPVLNRLADPGASAALLMEGGRVARITPGTLDLLDGTDGTPVRHLTLPSPRREATWLVQAEGRLMRMGGTGADGAPTAALDHVVTGDFFVMPGTPLPRPLRGAQGIRLPGGQLALLGGTDGQGLLRGDLLVYHPKDRFFLTLATLRRPRRDALLQAAPGGWLVVSGGTDAAGRPVPEVERIHLESGRVQAWRPSQTHAGPMAVLPLADGSLLAFQRAPRQPVYRLR